MISFEKFVSVAEKGFGFCDVVFGWDAADVAYDNAAITGWHTGYPDALATIDIQTFRQIPWENDLPFFLADFSDEKRNLAAVCPRTLLKQIKQQAIKADISLISRRSLNGSILLTTGKNLYKNNFRNPQPMTPGMFGYSILRASQEGNYFHDLFDSLKKFNVPIEGIHTETGPGVYEAAILYSEILEAADRAVLFKSRCKRNCTSPWTLSHLSWPSGMKTFRAAAAMFTKAFGQPMEKRICFLIKKIKQESVL